ncbi:MAG: DNA double-strand break repair nuclease NurA [Candidatus Methanomethyliaceae archaeon]
MPLFLEDFAYLLKSKQKELKDRIFKGPPNLLEVYFRRHLISHWISLDSLKKFSANPGDLEVLAVDSSVYTNLLSNGGIFYIIRSLAARKDVINKKIETNVIFSKSPMSRINEMINAKMEILEFEVALEALEDGFDGDAIIFDGSLYGRVSHVPIEYKIEGEGDVLLHYFNVYKSLVDACYKSNILLIGVSKESRSTFYRDYLLSLILDEILRKTDIEDGDKKLLKEIFFQILDVEIIAFEKFLKLKNKYPDKLETVELILKELASSRPDYQLIINYVSSVGYLQPLLLGPSLRMMRRFREFNDDPKKFISKCFPRLTMDKGEKFIQWASDILKNLLNFPSFISFYFLLDLRDSPIRVDIPYYGKSLSEVGWPKPVKVDINELLKIMVTGYCGLNSYNLWVKNVDEKVRLRRKVVDDIYFPYLERLFGEKIIRGRSYRRVKYP